MAQIYITLGDVINSATFFMLGLVLCRIIMMPGGPKDT